MDLDRQPQRLDVGLCLDLAKEAADGRPHVVDLDIRRATCRAPGRPASEGVSTVRTAPSGWTVCAVAVMVPSATVNAPATETGMDSEGCLEARHRGQGAGGELQPGAIDVEGRQPRLGQIGGRVSEGRRPGQVRAALRAQPDALRNGCRIHAHDQHVGGEGDRCRLRSGSAARRHR